MLAGAAGGERGNDVVQVLETDMVSELRSSGSRGSALQIAESLIGYPVIDVRTAQGLIGRSFEAANQAVKSLVEKGLLREITGRPQDRLFLCERVFDLIES
ncbi:MAG: hypothetical protein ACT4PP_01770 [Sporichthyaceae bacterium]